MPIEIRELIIKTEVNTNDKYNQNGISKDDITNLKRQLLEECKRIITKSKRRNNYKR
ncbi:DUF5908 family protein [uncultured Winogradskyella sp.]|uniref:DUF5908 family protein n=1 Tax=uncultured Winogradskyella sp. TaxID=395353 RepID=UPI003421BB3E